MKILNQLLTTSEFGTSIDLTIQFKPVATYALVFGLYL